MPEISAFTIRPFALDTDLPTLARLLADVEATDQEGEDVGEATLRDLFAAFGATRTDGRWVALAPDDPARFIGWGSVWQMPGATEANIQVAVHPAWRRRGLGGVLLARVLIGLR
ncbi:MAG TPA: GNAT family N-acetyltransferase, partial [Ktedonobacterales bacterium]